jgi:protein MPE1
LLHSDICYHCANVASGHWIQQCPTNADPNYDGRPRVKRTTGIPRSFLKTVEKPLPPSSDDPTMNHQNPTSVMVNAEGEYVVAQPDQASWESYQKKAGTANRPDAPKGNKELQDKGIECSMCHKLMRDAVQTPCCSKVYCEECIQNALLESDFVCPSCDAKEILLDALIEDKEMRIKVEEYKKEKENAGKITDAVKANSVGGNLDNRKSASPPASTPNGPLANRIDSVAPQQPSPPTAKSNTVTPIPSTESMANKKRPAEEDLGPEIPRGPAAMRNVQPPINFPTSYGPQNGQGMYNPATFQQQYPNHGQQAFNNGFNNFSGPPMNPMMMHQNFGYNSYGYNPGFNGGYGGPHANFSSSGYGPGISMEMNGGYGMGSQGFNVPVSHDGFLGGQKMMNGGSVQFGSGFPNQQKTVFSEPFPSEEDSPYMRKPVNPHRHARPKRIRPSDFKAVGGEMM